MLACIQLRRVAAAVALTLILVVTVVAVASGTAAAAALFDPATAVEMRAAPLSGGTMRDSLRGPGNRGLRNRLVTLNASELARIVPAGADNAGNRLERARALSGAVTLDLFPGVSVTAQRTDIQTPDDGGYVWLGRAGGAQPVWAALVINNKEILGHIQAGGRLYSVEPVSGNLHRIIEIDQDKIRDDLHLPSLKELLETKADTAAPPAAPTSFTTTGTITVMVAHTTNARLEAGTPTQMQARINLGIALANQAFINSGVNLKFVRVGGANEVNYNENGPYGGLNARDNYVGMLCDLSGLGCSSIGVSNNRTGTFSALRRKRNNVAADLVILMRKQGFYCGVAWINDPPTASTAYQGFSVVTSSPSYSCIEGNSVAHETGHNMGLQHDRVQYRNETGNAPSSSRTNFGYVDKTGKFFDIMASRSSCGSGCTRAPYFSTPLKKYPNINGRPLGIARYISGAADATRTLNATWPTVSHYR
jgi:peptidyl-Asp metalloendopeptidase